MTIRDLLMRRSIGPLSVSPVGVAIFCMVAVVAGIIASRVFEAKELQEQIYSAKNYAYPIAAQARLMQEQTGKWPDSLAEIGAGKAK